VIHNWRAIAFEVMRKSQGGITQAYIDELIFPDLADLWETAVSITR